MKTTASELIEMGMRPEQAAALILMTPAERMVFYPIAGNHWQDSPLFQTIDEVLDDPNASIDLKRIALMKQREATGEPWVKLSDAEVLAEIEETYA